MAEYKREIFLKESCPALLKRFSQNLRKFCGEDKTLGGKLGIFKNLHMLLTSSGLVVPGQHFLFHLLVSFYHHNP